VFAFAVHNPAFDTFFKSSLDGLHDGFKLQRALFMPPRPEALGAMILGRASNQEGFGLVYEGHTTFDTLIRELAHGEIWPDDPT
jgi:hypothetical protein